MWIDEAVVRIRRPASGESFLTHVIDEISGATPVGDAPLRVAITDSTGPDLVCEVGTVRGAAAFTEKLREQFSGFRRRRCSTSKFNVVLLVPTGIGAEIGGDAGDATPVARMLATTCDYLITHPNVVNASDINELPANGLYVEGSILTRFMLGTIGLQVIRSNKVLVIIDEHSDDYFFQSAINSVGAARASLGLDVAVLPMKDLVSMRAQYASSGRATGRVDGFDRMIAAVEDVQRDFDAIGITSVIELNDARWREYFQSNQVNPWGGVEALLTHGLAGVFDKPAAHSPMMEDRVVLNEELGIVDPSKAAEAVSLTFLHCILKGLHSAPRVVVESGAQQDPNLLTVGSVGCIVIPDGCLGVPTLAALEQGVPVIAVSENRNLMRNDLESVCGAGRVIRVRSYLEAAGVIACLRSGVSPECIQRPFRSTRRLVRAAEGSLHAVPGKR